MFYIAVTRFSTLTWRENANWRQNNGFEGCIYNSPRYIKDDIPLEMPIYIIEMNNDTNQIIGIGRIINKVFTDKKYNIYHDQCNRNYNRYTYKGEKYLSREKIVMAKNELKLVEAIEQSLFKGKGHLKRGQGIQIVPVIIFMKFGRYIKELF